MSITPLPPGVDVEFASSAPPRFGTPGTATVGLVGLFDQGSVASTGNAADLASKMGARTTYSRTTDDAGVLFALGATEVVCSRVVGPGAVLATLTLNDSAPVSSMRVDAITPGAWGNSIFVVLATPATLTLTLGSVTEQFVGSSKADLISQVNDGSTGSALVRLTDLNSIKTLAAKTSTALASGDDDRANITVTQWAAAFAALDARYGPMTVLASSATATNIQEAALDHCAAFGREAFLECVVGANLSTLESQASALASGDADSVQFGGLFGNWAYTRANAGDPERLVPWSVVQAGVAARVDNEQGPAVSPFGPTNGDASSVVTRLYNQFSDADRHTLYEANVNVATDDGTTFSTLGYRTLDSTPIANDLQVLHIKMAIKFEATGIAKGFIGSPATQQTGASYAGRLDALGQEWVKNQALIAYGEPVVTVDSVGRQLHGTLPIIPAGSIDWVDLIIPVQSI